MLIHLLCLNGEKIIEKKKEEKTETQTTAIEGDILDLLQYKKQAWERLRISYVKEIQTERETEAERQRERETQTERKRERETEAERKRERETKAERKREGETERRRCNKKKRQRQRNIVRERPELSP